jgi:hypothetical protein
MKDWKSIKMGFSNVFVSGNILNILKYFSI